MKKIKTNDFNILEFSEYKNVKGQYTSQFIKNSCCVKLEETETKVTVVVSESKKNSIKILKKVQ